MALFAETVCFALFVAIFTSEETNFLSCYQKGTNGGYVSVTSTLVTFSGRVTM